MKQIRSRRLMDDHRITLIFCRVEYVGGGGDQDALMEGFERLRQCEHGGGLAAGADQAYELMSVLLYVKCIKQVVRHATPPAIGE